VKETIMPNRQVVRTTLGELIVAVTDEVMPFIRDPLGLNMAVACIVTDVLAQNHVRDHFASGRKFREPEEARTRKRMSRKSSQREIK
jgi:hypothetical protein